MYIVGIDIGKNHHEASIVSPKGKQIGRSLRFATTHKGADSLMSFIFKNIGNSPCVFGMEVPCCGGLEHAAKTALQNSGKFIPWQVVTISTDGQILD